MNGNEVFRVTRLDLTVEYPDGSGAVLHGENVRATLNWAYPAWMSGAEWLELQAALEAGLLPDHPCRVTLVIEPDAGGKLTLQEAPHEPAGA